MPGVALALAGVAGLLVYSGFRGLSPVDVLISIFTGKAIEKTLAVPNVAAGGGTSPNTPIPPARKCVPKPGAPKAIALTVFHDVSGRFPFVFNLGITVVKKIKGTDTWSQHSFGNAVDIGVIAQARGCRIWLAKGSAGTVQNRSLAVEGSRPLQSRSRRFLPTVRRLPTGRAIERKGSIMTTESRQTILDASGDGTIIFGPV